MKFSTGIFFVVLLLIPVFGSAQLSEKLAGHFGFIYEQTTLTAIDDPAFTASYSFYMVHLGAYYMLAHKNDMVSVGIDPSIQLGVRFNTNDISWNVQAPIFLMGRFGAGATVYNQQKIGIGAGIGGVVNYMNIRGLVGFDPNTGLNRDFSFNELLFIPSLILEGSILTQGGALTGRMNITLFKPNGQGTVFTGSSIATMPASYSLFGLGLIYSI